MAKAYTSTFELAVQKATETLLYRNPYWVAIFKGLSQSNLFKTVINGLNDRIMSICAGAKQARTVRSHICSKTDSEELSEWRKKTYKIFHNFKPMKDRCMQKGSLHLLETEMMDFNCNKEGGYTLEKL